MSEVLLCMSEVLLCMSEVLLCMSEVLLCMSEVLLCMSEVLLCMSEVLLCMSEVLLCMSEVLLCMSEVLLCVSKSFILPHRNPKKAKTFTFASFLSAVETVRHAGLSGKITHILNNKAIEGVTITIQDYNKSAVTEKSGKFKITPSVWASIRSLSPAQVLSRKRLKP